MTIQDVTMKPVHDITRHCHRRPEPNPIPPTNQGVKYTAKSSQLPDLQTYHLKRKLSHKLGYSARLTRLWVYLAHYLDMQSFWLRGLFCRKATKSRSLFLDFSLRIQIQLTILSEQLSNSKHDRTIIFHHHPTILIIIMFHFLLYVVKGSSSLIGRKKRTIRIEFLNLARQT